MCKLATYTSIVYWYIKSLRSVAPTRIREGIIGEGSGVSWCTQGISSENAEEDVGFSVALLVGWGGRWWAEHVDTGNVLFGSNKKWWVPLPRRSFKSWIMVCHVLFSFYCEIGNFLYKGGFITLNLRVKNHEAESHNNPYLKLEINSLAISHWDFGIIYWHSTS